MSRGKEQQAGIDYEKKLAALVGGRLTPGSGNQWFAKGDISTRVVKWWLKHTGKQSFTISKAILREAIVAANEEGAIPAWAFDIAGEDFILMRGNDFRMLQEEEEKIIPSNKSAAKRRLASTSVLRRSMHDEKRE